MRGEISSGELKYNCTNIVSLINDYTDQVKLTDDKIKSSSSCLFLAGLTYIYVFVSLIHEILKFVFIMSVNIIFTNPWLFTVEMNPVQAWLLLNLVFLYFMKGLYFG